MTARGVLPPFETTPPIFWIFRAEAHTEQGHAHTPAHARKGGGLKIGGAAPHGGLSDFARFCPICAAFGAKLSDLRGFDRKGAGDVATKRVYTTDERITKEYRRLKRLFITLDQNTLKTADSLLKQAARLTVALEDIWVDYNKIGYMEEYDNGGGQKGMKASNPRRAINEMTKLHTAIMKQLTELVPPAPPAKDELDELINS